VACCNDAEAPARPLNLHAAGNCARRLSTCQQEKHPLLPTRHFSNALQGHNSRFTGNAAQPTGQQARVGFLLLEHFSLPAFTQALDTLVTANLIQPEACASTTFSLMAARSPATWASSSAPPGPWPQFEQPLDLFVVLRTALAPSAELAGLLQALARKGVALGGLWNGAWFRPGRAARRPPLRRAPGASRRGGRDRPAQPGFERQFRG
jgi:hypothetical protein